MPRPVSLFGDNASFTSDTVHHFTTCQRVSILSLLVCTTWWSCPSSICRVRTFFRAKIEQIYSCGKGITPDRLGTEFEFYSGPATWGNVPLQIGERALLFVHQVSGVFNEYPWRGHMVLEEIDGESYARLQIPELWLRDDLPEAVKAAAAPHPTRRNASIVRFGALENYLKGLIEKAVR